MSIPLTGAGSSVSDPYAAYLIYDSFTEAGGDVALQSHTPEKGGVWVRTATALNFVVKGAGAGVMQPPISQAAEWGYVQDAGRADVTIIIDLADIQASYQGIVFNYQDASNYWVFYASANNVTYYLRKWIAGVETVIGNAGVVAAGSSHQLKVVTLGDSVTCYVDGVSTITTAPAGRQLKTATKHGVYAGFTGPTPQKFDRITIA